MASSSLGMWSDDDEDEGGRAAASPRSAHKPAPDPRSAEQHQRQQPQQLQQRRQLQQRQQQQQEEEEGEGEGEEEELEGAPGVARAGAGERLRPAGIDAAAGEPPSVRSAAGRVDGALTPPTPSTPGCEGGNPDSFRRQLFRYLLESLNRSVDELYCLCGACDVHAPRPAQQRAQELISGALVLTDASMRVACRGGQFAGEAAACDNAVVRGGGRFPRAYASPRAAGESD